MRSMRFSTILFLPTSLLVHLFCSKLVKNVLLQNLSKRFSVSVSRAGSGSEAPESKPSAYSTRPRARLTLLRDYVPRFKPLNVVSGVECIRASQRPVRFQSSVDRCGARVSTSSAMLEEPTSVIGRMHDIVLFGLSSCLVLVLGVPSSTPCLPKAIADHCRSCLIFPHHRYSRQT